MTLPQKLYYTKYWIKNNSLYKFDIEYNNNNQLLHQE